MASRRPRSNSHSPSRSRTSPSSGHRSASRTSRWRAEPKRPASIAARASARSSRRDRVRYQTMPATTDVARIARASPGNIHRNRAPRRLAIPPSPFPLARPYPARSLRRKRAGALLLAIFANPGRMRQALRVEPTATSSRRKSDCMHPSIISRYRCGMRLTSWNLEGESGPIDFLWIFFSKFREFRVGSTVFKEERLNVNPSIVTMQRKNRARAGLSECRRRLDPHRDGWAPRQGSPCAPRRPACVVGSGHPMIGNSSRFLLRRKDLNFYGIVIDVDSSDRIGRRVT